MYNMCLADKLYINLEAIKDIGIFKAYFTHKMSFNVTIREYTLFPKQNMIAVPVGYYSIIKKFLRGSPTLKNKQVSTKLNDLVLCDFRGNLRPEQEQVLESWYKVANRSGILVAKAGFGKTVVASHMICTYRKPTLIVVPTIMILNQWVASIEKFTGINPSIIAGGVCDISNLTIACSKSLIKPKVVDKLKNRFSLVIVDEAHTACAPKIRNVLNSLYADQKIGLTATPYRKDQTHFHLNGLFGYFRVESKDAGIRAVVRIEHTDHEFDFSEDTDYIEALTVLSKNIKFAELVANNIAIDYSRKRNIIVLSPRIEHLDLLHEKIEKLNIPSARLLSVKNKTDEQHNREILVEARERGLVLLGTYQLVGTGFDADFLDCMHLPYSFNNQGLFVQLVGRIERKLEGKPKPELVDYMFQYKNYTKIQQNARLTHYKKLGYAV